MRCWNTTRELMMDEAFVAQYTVCRSPFLPFHMAFLYSGNRLVCAASNMSAYGHAEMNCIASSRIQHIKRNKPVKLIVVRQTMEKALKMSRPCKDCCMFLRKRLPRARVFYTDDTGTLTEDTHLDNTHASLAARTRVSKLCSTIASSTIGDHSQTHAPKIQ